MSNNRVDDKSAENGWTTWSWVIVALLFVGAAAITALAVASNPQSQLSFLCYFVGMFLAFFAVHLITSRGGKQ